MKTLQFLAVLIFFSACNNNHQITNEKKQKIDEALNCTENWFRAWELVSKEVFKLEKQSSVRFVFFDSMYVYTTSPITGQGGTIINGPKLFDEEQVWYKKKHEGFILLPDSTKSQIQMMIFASPSKELKVKAYFVMPLLSFWIKEKVDGHGIGLEKLTAGVFTHEFLHTTQIESFDKFGEYFEAYQTKFGTENFGDDMMQNLFENDTIIKLEYEKEIDKFREAVRTNESGSKKLTKDALTIFINKHNLIFEKYKKDLKKLDDIWLTMEGIGQYAMYQYFINPKGGNLTEKEALKAIKTRWWSQEEGLEMFLLLAKYKKPETWPNVFLNSDMKTIIEILEKEVK